MDSLAKKKPGRPPKQQPASDEPAVSIARPVVDPSTPADPVLYVIPKRAWMLGEAICLRDRGTLPADLRSDIEGALGCLFTLDEGKLRTVDARHMRIVDHADRVELVA